MNSAFFLRKGDKMKALKILVFVLSMILVTSPAFAVGFGGLNFEGEPYITFEPANVSFFFTTPEIKLGDYQLWVKWKLNLSNLSWEIFAADLESNVSGESTASGNYFFDLQRGVLILDVKNTNYVGCGFNYGVQVWFVSSLTSTTIVISSPFEGSEIALTRQGGGSGILGTWSAMMDSNTMSVTLNGDGTFTGVANIVQCLSD
jgi:hypothetical protein